MSDIPKLTIKEFRPEEQPQEKAERYGIQSLNLNELWAVILRAGQPGVPITELTSQIMGKCGHKLKNLERMSRQELMEFDGIGPVKALQMEAVLEIMRRYNREKIGDRVRIRSASDIFEFMRTEAGRHNEEHIWVLMLSRSNHIIKESEVSKGGTSSTVFDVKRLMREIVTTPRAESVVMVHNHPSGSLMPSVQDDRITKSLKQACEFMGFKMLDHVIVTQDGYYSYNDNGRL